MKRILRLWDAKSQALLLKNSKKESPLDFALWKKTDVGIKWKTPWGEGRPGWHTECCVMIDTIFDRHMIDIHGGGYDLKFPHHENEIAQAEAMNGNKIAKYWMHNAFINFNNEKMSKSLGNVVYAKDLIAQNGGAVSRLVILNAHYRQPVNFTDDTLSAAAQEVKKIQAAVSQVALQLQVNGVDMSKGQPKYIQPFLDAMADDLNTANALAHLYSVIKDMNQAIRTREIDFNNLNDLFKSVNDMLYVLGLDIPFKVLSDEDKALYKAYLESKANKDFAKSDEIRQELIAKGIM